MFRMHPKCSVRLCRGIPGFTAGNSSIESEILPAKTALQKHEIICVGLFIQTHAPSSSLAIRSFALESTVYSTGRTSSLTHGPLNLTR